MHARFLYAFDLDVERLAGAAAHDLERTGSMQGVGRVGRVTALPARMAVALPARIPVAQVQHAVALTSAQA